MLQLAARTALRNAVRCAVLYYGLAVSFREHYDYFARHFRHNLLQLRGAFDVTDR